MSLSVQRMVRGVTAMMFVLFSTLVWADSGVSSYNMPVGVTGIAKETYELHMIAFYVCCAIGLVVFGAMFYSVFAHRRSKGAKAADFHESVLVEILWTLAPFVILIALAIPAARLLIKRENTPTDYDMTVRITGYQWKWKYEYVMPDGKTVAFYSTLDAKSNETRQTGSGINPGDTKAASYNANYLLDVDHPLYLPVGKKIRFQLTSEDVIHAWWVKELALKKDAIPGYVNEMWTTADETGVYRGVCAELCGRDHGFMPIVVNVVTMDEFAKFMGDKANFVNGEMNGMALVDALKQGKAVAKAETPAPVAVAEPAEVAVTTAPATEPNPATGTPAAIAAAPAGLFPAKIVFATGKTALDDAQKATIAKIAEYLKANAGAKVDLTGYTDTSGSVEKNKEIAKERAKAVREALKAGGVTEAQWTMKPPAELTGSGSAEEARRVEISLSAAQAAAPAAAPQPAAASAPTAAQPAAAPAKLDKAALMEKGAKVYAMNCSACHGAEGKGTPPTFPPITGSQVANGVVGAHITQVIRGKGMMPAFAQLSDEDIAAVVTYQRNALGNSKGDMAQPADVKALR